MDAHNLMQDKLVLALIKAALSEDVGSGDATTAALVDPAIIATSEIITREACRVAGATVGQKVLNYVDPALQIEILVPDGSDAAKGQSILKIHGSAASILTAERTALNFMQRMCGIATLTNRFVEAVKPYHTRILDTRKTTPGFRLFEKNAVLCGGGANHRFGLFDRVLIKDNHRRLWHGGDPERLDLAVMAARKAFPQLIVEVEVESLAECVSVLRAKPEWVMLDNMNPTMMRECVALCKGIALTEASGGITLEQAHAVAATGVDAISLGCLTHSAPSVDLSLEWSVV